MSRIRTTTVGAFGYPIGAINRIDDVDRNLSIINPTIQVGKVKLFIKLKKPRSHAVQGEVIRIELQWGLAEDDGEILGRIPP